MALGGEAPSKADIRAVWAASPGLRVVNRYGPTETTIAVAHLELTPELLDAGLVPIGRPHPGSSFHLVDEHGRLVNGPGVVGELYIGGRQLMAGYLNDPALSSAVLRTDVVEGTALYRTGDLVLRDDRGNYVYVGRSDRVIKRHGVRMSLVEVTEALGGIDGLHPRRARPSTWRAIWGSSHSLYRTASSPLSPSARPPANGFRKRCCPINSSWWPPCP